jgi:ABC-type lipoprotein release transport system permease subunit
MLLTLAFRHLWVRKIRSLFLLFGFSLGVGVMIVLLSVGEAMLDQSRDVSLIGGGEVTILPQGIDIDAMRTGGAGGMFFTIDRARFLTRQVLGGARRADLVRTVSPALQERAGVSADGSAGWRGDTEPGRCSGCRPEHTARHLEGLARRLRLHRAIVTAPL